MTTLSQTLIKLFKRKLEQCKFHHAFVLSESEDIKNLVKIKRCIRNLMCWYLIDAKENE